MTTQQKRRLSAFSIVTVLALVGLLAFYFVSTATADDKKADQTADKTKDQKSDSDKADSQAAQDEKGEKGEAEDGKAEDEKAPIPVRAVAVQAGTVSTYISSTANLVPENQVKVLAEWEGRIDDLEIEEGDRIRRDQILAGLAREDGEIAVKKAKVKASNAQLAFDRAEKLRNQELLSPEDFEKISLERELAVQELAEAEWRLEKTYIRAPFDGFVTERAAQPGQHVRPGDELFTVADFDPLVARIYLPEKDVLSLREGRDVRISLKADESVLFPGRIRQISPIVDTASGTVKVTIEATHTPPQVRPGAFVRIDVVRETRSAAVLVPREAIVRELQKTYVFVAKDGIAEKRPVTLGLEENGQVEVTAGAELGEQVIVAGQGGLKNGADVELIDDESA